jgi:16S rRNA (guanine966-N2)-methyltransferase
MRIIAGSRARMTILSPVGFDTRPITDRVKESLFAILQPIISDAVVADLFCGTGSLGLEAISRGARFAVMTDQNRDAIQLLNKNLVKLDFTDRASAIRADIYKIGVPEVEHPLLNDSQGQKLPWNLVFVDPPYAQSQDASLTSRLGGLLIRISQQIADGAVVVVRHEKHSRLIEQYGTLKISDIRRYGGMTLTFLEKRGQVPFSSPSENVDA